MSASSSATWRSNRIRQHEHVHLLRLRRSGSHVVDAGGRVRFLAQIHDAPGTPLNQRPHHRGVTEDYRRTYRRRHHHHPALDDLLRDPPRPGAAIPPWASVSRGRRCPRPQPRGRPGHEHRHAGRLQPVLEARAGDRRVAPETRSSTATTPSGIPSASGSSTSRSTLTTIGTLTGLARVARNAVVKVIGHVPPAVRVMATNITETNIVYEGSPAVLTSAPRHAKVVAGQHVPHIHRRRTPEADQRRG